MKKIAPTATKKEFFCGCWCNFFHRPLHIPTLSASTTRKKTASPPPSHDPLYHRKRIQKEIRSCTSSPRPKQLHHVGVTVTKLEKLLTTGSSTWAAAKRTRRHRAQSGSNARPVIGISFPNSLALSRSPSLLALLLPQKKKAFLFRSL